MKNIFFKIAVLVSALCLLAGCGKAGVSSGGEDKGIKIVCTVFPVYDWVRELTGGGADIYFISGGNSDMHSYQATAEDMIKIAECDLLIYIGGESDKWIAEAAGQSKNEKRTELKLLELLGGGVRNIEGHDEADEHVWLSPENAALFAEKITDALEKADTSGKIPYRENCEKYTGRLRTLDNAYHTAVESSAKRPLIFADRYPFRYLCEEYGITAFAAFDGCSAESEASFETAAFLTDKAEELGVKYILVIDGSDKKLAGTVISGTAAKNQEILTADSMQSTTLKDAKNGVNYIGIMEKNLEVFKKALA